MGFWQDFTGASAKKDIRNAYGESTNMLSKGYNDSRKDINKGYAGAQADLGNQRNALSGGYDQARADVQGGMSDAIGRLDQLGNNGGYAGASRMYADALGANGSGAQNAFAAHYSSGDPFRAQNEDFAQNALARQMAAHGQLNSGNAYTAAVRGSLERGSQDWNSYLDRLHGLGSEGAQIGQQAAGIRMNGANALSGYAQQHGQNMGDSYGQGAGYNVQQGNALGGMAYQYGMDRAGNRINYGNAQASNRSTGINNILGLLGAGANAFGSLYKPRAV